MIELPAEHRRRLRTAIWKSPFRSVAAFARAAGFPADNVTAMLRGPAAFSVGYYRRLLDAARDLLGIDLPVPVPSPELDVLAQLVKIGRLKEPEADAGRALRAAAEGWEFPGLEPSPDLVRAWPASLRNLWRALRAADVETNAFRPPLPTCTSTVWCIAINDERPAVLGAFPRAHMARLEITSLRIGLKALVEALAAGIPDDEPVSAPAFDILEDDRAAAAEKAERVSAAIAAASSMSIPAAAAASGLCPDNIKRLRAITRTRPDLLPDIEAGRLSIYMAGVKAGVVRSCAKSDGTTRIGRTPQWPPQSAGSWKIFNAVKARDPDLAARVERQELSVNAAGLLCGYLKPSKKQTEIAA